MDKYANLTGSFLRILFLFLAWQIAVPSCLAEQKTETETSLWWETLAYGFRGADQSTAPAPDLIPYDYIKDTANELIVKPTQEGFDGPAPQQSPLIKYDQHSNLIRKLRRDYTMQSVQRDRRSSYPTSMGDLDAQPSRGGPIGGSDVAPTGGKIRPVRAPRKSFTQVAGPIVKKHFDPNQAVGKIKILDTLQAIQHLIDCQNKGISANECFKQYGINFAMSKAITEVLTAVGQHAGWYFAENAGLGQAVVGGTFTVGYLAYADYLAVQEIMALGQVMVDTYGDKLDHQRQAENNLGSDQFNWSGALPDLQTRLDLFQQQFDSYLVAAGEELFEAWAATDEAYQNAKGSRQDLNNVLKESFDPEKLRKELETECYGLLAKEDPPALANVLKAIDEKTALASKNLERANNLAKKCSSEEEAESIRAIYELLKGIEKDLEADLKEERKLIEELTKGLREAYEAKKESLIEEYKKAEELRAAYEEFTDHHFAAVVSSWRSERAYADYNKLRKLYLARWKRFKFFLSSRAEEILVGENLERAKGMLANTESYLKNFKPKRIPFDNVAGYNKELQGVITELKYMERVGVKLKQEIEKAVKALEAVKVECDFEQKDETGDKQIADLIAGINKLPQLAKECAAVEIPKLTGMKISEAIRQVDLLRLEAKPDKIKEVCLEQRNSNIVTSQKPNRGAKVRRGSEVVLVHWGPFDKEAKCKKLQNDVSGNIADKNLEEAKRLLREMRSLGCKDSDKSAAEIQRAEDRQRDEERVFLPKLIGYALEDARNKIIKLGFESDGVTDIEEFRSGDFARNGKVKSQKPPGDTYQPKGAAVKLQYWKFDARIAENQANCSNLKGSQATWNQEQKRVECLCPGATLAIKLGSQGFRCAACDDVKLYFDRELGRGNKKEADRVLRIAEGQRCTWASQAVNESSLEDRAADFCNSRIPGSVPVSMGGTKISCQCPADTVAVSGPSGQSCMSCAEAAGKFNAAIGRKNVKSAASWLNSSKHCPGADSAEQALANLQQQIQRQQQDFTRQQQQQQHFQSQMNNQRCSFLQQQLANACNMRQWMSYSNYLLQIRSMPGCRLDQNLVNRCNAMQNTQRNQGLNQYSLQNNRPGTRKPSAPPRKPQKPSKPEQNTSKSSYAWYVVQRDIKSQAGAGINYIKKYYCDDLPSDPGKLRAAVAQMNRDVPAGEVRKVIKGPYPLLPGEANRFKKNCPAGSVPKDSSKFVAR